MVILFCEGGYLFPKKSAGISAHTGNLEVSKSHIQLQCTRARHVPILRQLIDKWMEEMGIKKCFTVRTGK